MFGKILAVATGIIKSQFKCDRNGAATMKNLKENFKNPPKEYGVYPMSHGRIMDHVKKPECLTLEGVQKHGFAGAVANLSYSRFDEVKFPDQEKDWNDFEAAARKYIDNGLPLWIYDEAGYPSGTAGGSVIERNPDHPEYEAVQLSCYIHPSFCYGPGRWRADIPDGKFEFAVLVSEDNEEAYYIPEKPDENGVLYFKIPKGVHKLHIMTSKRCFDGTHASEAWGEPRRYVNLMDAGATKKFIEYTHENYARKLKDKFGNGIKAFFTDEPSLIAWNIDRAVYPVLPWHKDFPKTFKKQYGYDIAKAVVAAALNKGAQKAKRKCDFWDFVANKVADNYFGVIQDWCHENGAASGGHMLREESLRAHIVCYGSFYRSAKRFDVPGIDMLDGAPEEVANKEKIPFARLMGSIADVYGRKETFTEFSGQPVTAKCIKASANMHLAMGINNFLSYYDIEKLSSKTWVNINNYIARLGFLTRQGKHISDVALVYPEHSMWAEFQPSVGYGGVNDSEEILKIEETFYKTSWQLFERQVDFDYIDEQIISDGEIKDGALEFNTRRYKTVIFPACHVLSEKTVSKMVDMLKAGVKIILIGDMPKISRESGEKCDFAKSLKPFVRKGQISIVPITENWALPSRLKTDFLPKDAVIREDKPKNFADGEPVAKDIIMQTRELENGDMLYFVVNMANEAFNGKLILNEGVSAEEYVSATGKVKNAKTETKDGKFAIKVAVAPLDSVSFVVKKSN